MPSETIKQARGGYHNNGSRLRTVVHLNAGNVGDRDLIRQRSSSLKHVTTRVAYTSRTLPECKVCQKESEINWIRCYVLYLPLTEVWTAGNTLKRSLLTYRLAAHFGPQKASQACSASRPSKQTTISCTS